MLVGIGCTVALIIAVAALRVVRARGIENRDRIIKTSAPAGEGRLANIYASFNRADFGFVKAAFVKMFGQPHKTDSPPQGESGEFLSWIGNKAEIRLSVLRDDAAFVISPNMIARGGKVGSSLELLPTPRKR